MEEAYERSCSVICLAIKYSPMGHSLINRSLAKTSGRGDQHQAFRSLIKNPVIPARLGVTASGQVCSVIVSLLDPIRNHIHNHIGLNRIIGDEMYCKVVRAIHAFVHHKDAGFNRGAFTGLKDHRTDGQLGWSAPLHDFDVGNLCEA